MKAAVLLFPGSNRERDVARALAQAVSIDPRIKGVLSTKGKL